MPIWPVIIVSGLYLGVLFTIAWWGDRLAGNGLTLERGSAFAGLSYALTLAIYNTSWSFYGSVGRAATSGLDFLPIYLGPTLVLIFGRGLLRKVVTIAKTQNVTSIADFIGARYGKSQFIAAFVTLASLMGMLPYIALQLKAVGASFDVVTASSSTFQVDTQPPFWRDTAFVVAVSMAIFTLIFGVRHIHAKEHHRGLMLAVAFESLVKLAAFVMVALFIVYCMSGGFTALLERAQNVGGANLLAIDARDPTWISNTIISIFAFLCLPQAFHVAIVENEDKRHVGQAALLFPGYLLVLSVFMIPIAIAGLATFGDRIKPDTFMIALPVSAGAETVSLVAFIGGLSAATGMNIVAAVSLSTMLCNDVIMPLLFRFAYFRGPLNVARILLMVRRAAVIVILILAYVTYRLIDKAYPLTSMGLLSFVAVAQFGPAFLAGLFWERASKAGAIAGMSAGLALWAYTLLLPSLVSILHWPPSFLEDGPWGIAWLRPQSLFGIAVLDTISHATLFSLAANGLALVIGSFAVRRNGVERSQAEAFVRPLEDQEPSSKNWRAVTTLQDLRGLATRFIGKDNGSAAFDAYLQRRRIMADPPLDGSGLADIDATRFIERLLAGAIGAASARVILAASLQGRSLSRGAAMEMLDEASEALHFNRKLLSASLESVRQGICVVDRDFHLAAWNRRLLELLDLPQDLPHVGLPLADIIAFNAARGEYARADFEALIINRDMGAQTWPYTYERRRPDGTCLEITFDRMPGGGYVATYSDVTERQRVAETLREANERLEARVCERTRALEHAKSEAEQANAAKTRFLAAAGHDLLQPLSAARLFVTTLQEKLRVGEVESEAFDTAKRAAAALTSTEQLLDSLLDISSLDSGAVHPCRRIFAIGDLLTQLGLEFSALAAQRHLCLHVVPCRVLVESDPQLLRRVLQNLLSNAIRYTPEGHVLIGCRRRGKHLRVDVLDTGIGIAPDQHQSIFAEFRRLPGNERIQEKGLGLGLAIVDRISKLLELNVSLRSAPGRGSCFSVELPTASAAPAIGVLDEDMDLAPAYASPALVLCFDNEEEVCAGTAALLREWGFHSEPATCLASALACLEGRVPDVVLIDYHLGNEMNGLDILATLRAHWHANVPALLVTADRSDHVRMQAQNALCHLLNKPIKPASLRRYLNVICLQGPIAKQHPDSYSEQEV